MHGQKKRRKRTRTGTIPVDGVCLLWELASEPQWSTEDGLIGLRFSVRSEDRRHRELILEYPFPKKRVGTGMPQVPQRPRFSPRSIEEGVREAMSAGWDPMSRGKAVVYRVLGASS